MTPPTRLDKKTNVKELLMLFLIGPKQVPTYLRTYLPTYLPTEVDNIQYKDAYVTPAMNVWAHLY